jgi:hypothetical protein
MSGKGLLRRSLLGPLNRRVTPAILALLTGMAVAPVASSVAAPRITRIAFSGDTANITETISGSGFGAAPAGAPCTSCSTALLSFVNQWRCFPSNINIDAWGDSQITVSGLAANPGDVIVTTVANSASQGATARAATVQRNVLLNLPVIKSVRLTGRGQALGITVTGSGFGSAPAGVPGVADLPYFEVQDVTQNFQVGHNGGPSDVSGTMLNYVSWTDTEIVISGMHGAAVNFARGDVVYVELWNGNSCTNFPYQSSNLTASWGGTFP